VAAAKLLQDKGVHVGRGSFVSYVVIKGKGKIRDRVALPDKKLQKVYDGEYYITNSLLPAVQPILSVLNVIIDTATDQKSLDVF